ncbi:nucleoid-associated protein [Aureimonas phyllosphaerae]|uniref:nucleoid-associated protein n=1 Tax=Aureimonas phyllosphaerae TaxID=1166078 RepID=UPI003A5BA03D
MLSEDEIGTLSIDRMVFHVVRPDVPEPLFLAEAVPPQFPEFFVKRVVDTLRGASYDFNEGSGMPALVSAALADARADGEDGFLVTSRSLARRFKEKVKGDNRMAAGALMLLAMSTRDSRLVALIKFDHHAVIRYSLENKDGADPKPLMESVKENFSQDRKAMQKSVVIRLADPGHADAERRRHRVVVIDRSSSRYRDATQHFENFLDVRRTFEKADLTQKLFEAARATIDKHRDAMPPELAKAPTRRLRETFERLEGFDSDTPEELWGALAGGLDGPAKEAVLKTFGRELANRAISTESFEFDRRTLPKREYKRLVAREGFALWFREEHEENGIVKVERDEDGSATITLRTAKLVQDDETDALPKVTG